MSEIAHVKNFTYLCKAAKKKKVGRATALLSHQAAALQISETGGDGLDFYFTRLENTSFSSNFVT
jgi:hypothetical protein